MTLPTRTTEEWKAIHAAGDKAWREGYEAGLDAAHEGKETDNPYPEGTSVHNLWEVGFANATDDAFWAPSQD